MSRFVYSSAVLHCPSSSQDLYIATATFTTAGVPHQVFPFVTAADRASACVGVYAMLPVSLGDRNRPYAGSLKKSGVSAGTGRDQTTLPRKYKATRGHGVTCSYNNSNNSTTALLRGAIVNRTKYC